MIMLEVEDLTVHYGVIQAIKGSAFRFRKGRFLPSWEPMGLERRLR